MKHRIYETLHLPKWRYLDENRTSQPYSESNKFTVNNLRELCVTISPHVFFLITNKLQPQM